MSTTVHVEHLARVEGHGGIKVEFDQDQIRRVEFDILEGARLIEPLVRGRSFEDVQPITSRICAICSAGHTVAALLAIEDAFEVQVSERTCLLRDLLLQGENIESHALHVFLLALPDFLGYPSAIAMASDKPEAVKLGLRLKKLGNTIQEVVGGRAVHPVSAVVGGFSSLPSVDDLVRLQADLEQGRRDAEAMIDLLAPIEMPRFSQVETVYAAIDSGPERFGFLGDHIAVSTGERMPVSAYRLLTNERPVPHSHAKHSLFNGQPFMVGALARLAINGEKLPERAKQAQARLGLTFPTGSALDNNTAQAVEIVYSIDRACEIVEQLLSSPVEQEELPRIVPRAGSGTAAVEAPRGTLYHSYTFDDRGRVTGADIITPTAQNCASVEKHFRATLEHCRGEDHEQLRLKLEMVARAYDPCISCSVH